MSRLFGKPVTPEVADHSNATCSFCGRHRREVHQLVVGSGANYICDGCIGLCVQIVDEEMVEKEARTYHADLLLAAVHQLGPRAPHARVRPLLRAVIELAEGSAAVLRRVYAAATLVEDDLVTGLAALAAIPPPARTTDDQLNRVATLANGDRCSDALAVLDTVDPSAVQGTDLIWHRLLRAFVELELGGLRRPRVAVHRSTALELARAVGELPAAPFADAMRAQRLAVFVLANLALGDHDEAEAAARERIALQPDSASAREHLARVLATRGDRAGAETALSEARERAHPEGPLARRLADRGEPFR